MCERNSSTFIILLGCAEALAPASKGTGLQPDPSSGSSVFASLQHNTKIRFLLVFGFFILCIFVWLVATLESEWGVRCFMLSFRRGLLSSDCFLFQFNCNGGFRH